MEATGAPLGVKLGEGEVGTGVLCWNDRNCGIGGGEFGAVPPAVPVVAGVAAVGEELESDIDLEIQPRAASAWFWTKPKKNSEN
jgi:hypothetical protein